eukprot:scaffold3522_cov37-Cyclotella_meneghiniana.AAC.2
MVQVLSIGGDWRAGKWKDLVESYKNHLWICTTSKAGKGRTKSESCDESGSGPLYVISQVVTTDRRSKRSSNGFKIATFQVIQEYTLWAVPPSRPG